MTHPSHHDALMARVLRVCWHSPTSDRWPCTQELDGYTCPPWHQDADGWCLDETPHLEARARAHPRTEQQED